jgi:hypothetical protein
MLLFELRLDRGPRFGYAIDETPYPLMAICLRQALAAQHRQPKACRALRFQHHVEPLDIAQPFDLALLDPGPI